MRKTTVAICLAIYFALRLAPNVLAMSCDNRGAADRLHYGSNVSGDQVTICAEYWWPRLPAKPVMNPKPVSDKPVVPLSFTVTPARPILYTNHQRTLSVGEGFDLQTNAKIHFRNGSLLGKKALVRFIPTLTVLEFGDGRKAVQSFAIHSYKSVGRYEATAKVRFTVSFRFVGTTRWLTDPRWITISTNRLAFSVVVGGSKESSGKPVLVWKNCLDGWRLGC